MASVVEDVFKSDNRTVDVQKVLFKLWQYRKTPEKTDEIVNILCQFVDEKETFADIEFYLPQFAHLIIHVEPNVQSRAMDLLAMVISQTSMHTALLLSFSFVAAMEDYQPELALNRKNPAANAFYFNRCARLLQDLEKAVVYGDSNKEADASRMNNSSVQKKTSMAQSLAQDKPQTVDRVLNGMLLFKRLERKSLLHTKQWSSRYFVVDQRVLLCFSDPHSPTPKRAISLQNCRIVVNDTHPKYGDTCFEVVNDTSGVRYLLRAVDPASRAQWVDFLTREITGAPSNTTATATASSNGPAIETTASNDSATSNVATPTAHVNLISKEQQVQSLTECDMTPAQRRRFRFFLQLRLFITHLTNICERLRFKEKDVRKYFLKRDMAELIVPPFAYLPVCRSRDHFRGILRTLPKECHAFTTKARVPALMLFEIQAHPDNFDVATFLGAALELYEDKEVFERDEDLMVSRKEVHDSAAESKSMPSDVDDVTNTDPTSLASPFRSVEPEGEEQESIWTEEGTGLARLRALGRPTPPAVVASPNTVAAAVAAEAALQDIALDVLDHESAGVEQGALGETFAGRVRRLRNASGYGGLPGWGVGGLIAKSNDDVRQEVFVIQLMAYYQRIFAEAQLPVWMHTYQIVSTSKSTGLIELIANATSLDGLKKARGYPGSLRAWYESSFVGPEALKAALENYIASQAAYSIVSYLLAIKDRHNGNVMVDKDGHFIHIDFGFVFGLAPGKQFSMERAPWKLNEEWTQVFGGRNSDGFREYRERCVDAFIVARKHAPEVTTLLEIMQSQSNFPAFRYNKNAIAEFRARMFLDRPDADVPKIVDSLISRSYRHSGTDLYDQFQLATNGIAV